MTVIDDSKVAPDYGGNKARKLEFLFGEAVSMGVKGVSTIGAVGSNHVVATATHAPKVALQTRALHFEQPWTPHVERNLLVAHGLGAKLTMVRSRNDIPAALAMERCRVAADPSQLWIPGGGSSALGALGYANAVLELKEREPSWATDRPQRIYVTAGTGGTFAGILVGLALSGWNDVEVVGVRVTDRIVCSASIIRYLIRGQRRWLQQAGIALPAEMPRWRLDSRFFAPGYGLPRAEADAAIQSAATAGLTLEATYTGRTFAALLTDRISEPRVSMAYWHTLNAQPLDEPLERGRASIDSLPEGHRNWLRAHRPSDSA